MHVRRAAPWHGISGRFVESPSCLACPLLASAYGMGISGLSCSLAFANIGTGSGVLTCSSQ